MKRFFVLFLLLFSFSKIVLAQPTSSNRNNVKILKCTKTFTFESGNGANPVLIQEEDTWIYTCIKYRTDIPIAELYSSVEMIKDVDIRVDGNKRSSIIPQFEYYNRDGIFYSDEKICFFTLPIQKIGSESEVTFKKTITDPRYLTNIFFVNEYPIDELEIKLIVPAWMGLDIKEYHFGTYAIQKRVEPGSDKTVYFFTAKNIPAFERYDFSPGITYLAPHLLILNKSASPKGQTFRYFSDLKDLYSWYHGLVMQIGDDELFVKQKAEELTRGIVSDEEKVKRIFLWVQDNIRYIAFEDGIAGFKPEKSQEVLKKKYGDCKGMANLLTVMLRSLKLDARRCWIGTKHIFYDYNTPTLSSDNHMICAWMKDGKPVFLDATEKYIGYGEVAERIQGRQTLIENGTQFMLEKVPVKSYLQNTSKEIRKLTLKDSVLEGHITHILKGESKEWMLSSLNNIKREKQEDALKEYFADGEFGFEISNIKVSSLADYNSDLRIEYDIEWKNIVTVFDKEFYLSLDKRLYFKNFKIEEAERKVPFWLNYKHNIIIETEVILPAGMTIQELPQSINVKRAGYNFTGSYSFSSGKLFYRNEIIVNDTEIKPELFGVWNKDIQSLGEFYDQQVVLAKK